MPYCNFLFTNLLWVEIINRTVTKQVTKQVTK